MPDRMTKKIIAEMSRREGIDQAKVTELLSEMSPNSEDHADTTITNITYYMGHMQVGKVVPMD